MLPGIAILLFYTVIWVVLRALRRNPNSTAARIAFAWQGPFPQDGERLSSYYRRKTWFALGWLLKLVVVSAILATAVWMVPAIQNAETFLLCSMFVLAIGMGMAALGALLVYAASLKARLVGPDPIFSSAAEFEQQRPRDPMDNQRETP
ncbi:hypothetical protein [Pseudoduganella sp. GCM10020061]|uniref:hypothetical protein n=1 Tax=Pseudoduganella sp. GCM10020061 TaxID=3317345 RepID=UPI003631BE1E